MKEYLGQYVKIVFKNGKQEIGKIPVLGEVPNEIIFLPYTKEKIFNRYFQNKSHALKNELSEFVNFFNLSEIDKIIKLDKELKNVKLENGKQLPNLMRLTFKFSEKPGHLGVEYKIDDNSPQIDIGDFPIIDGVITLPMKLAFISYAKEDKIDAIDLMVRLHSKGILTWFDEKDLLPGDSWVDKIESAIETSDYFMALFSSNTLNKIGFKQREIEYALEQKSLRPDTTRFIIPILLDDCVPPRKLRKIHWLKKTEKGWFDKLLLSLGYYKI